MSQAMLMMRSPLSIPVISYVLGNDSNVTYLDSSNLSQEAVDDDLNSRVRSEAVASGMSASEYFQSLPVRCVTFLFGLSAGPTIGRDMPGKRCP